MLPTLHFRFEEKNKKESSINAVSKKLKILSLCLSNGGKYNFNKF